MVCAQWADGDHTDDELSAVDTQLADNPLLSGLSREHRGMLVSMAVDAIRIAGVTMRASAIARGLPARMHRFAAFAMAADVCAVDRVVPAEADFLESLRLALRLSPSEADACIAAARERLSLRAIDDRARRQQALVPSVATMFALRGKALLRLDDAHRFAVADFFAALPDLHLPSDESAILLHRAFRSAAGVDSVFPALVELARSLPDPADRYWLLVYALTAEQPAIAAGWRVVPFIGLLQAAFGIADADTELAVADALCAPAALPRPVP